MNGFTTTSTLSEMINKFKYKKKKKKKKNKKK
jgi:hypothetical protein